MQELALAGSFIVALMGVAASVGFPPVATGAFWAVVTLYGVVSILFDDETPRGTPGLEVIEEIREKRQRSKS